MTKKTEQAIAPTWDTERNWHTPDKYVLSVARHQLSHAAPDHSPESRPGLMAEASEKMVDMLAPWRQVGAWLREINRKAKGR